ncbi:GGDEF domain-containing protein [Actinoplanes sp. NPDC049668]|uniref:GGDEF domain-containing protein n=1 Tax=unclassified Actinoplanes TaxID=2626549 RepID=UPI0033B402A8
MSTTPEASMLRKRRAVEGANFLSRGSGLLATVLFLAGWFGMPVPDEPQLIAGCLAGIAVMAIGNVLALINFRRPDGPRYGVLSAGQVAGDTLVMSGIVVWFQVYGDLTTWPGLIVPIVVGALRHRLRGALIAWAATSAVFAVTVIALGDQAVRPEDLPFAIAIHLFVAVLSGTQSAAYARQVKELNATRKALQHQATHDGLTGLPNRARITEYAEGLAGRELTVLLLDLNGFKLVNDVRGHATGDSVLREAGGRLRAGLRAGDLAGRLGGDEFVVLLPDTGPAEAAELSARLRAEIGRPVRVDGHEISVGVSIGAAHRPAGVATGLAALTAEADVAMYQDKTADLPRPSDRNGVYDPVR